MDCHPTTAPAITTEARGDYSVFKADKYVRYSFIIYEGNLHISFHVTFESTIPYDLLSAIQSMQALPFAVANDCTVEYEELHKYEV